MKVKEPSSFRPSSSEMCDMLEKANLENRGFQKEVARKSFQKAGRTGSDFEVRITHVKKIPSCLFIFLFVFLNTIHRLQKPILLSVLNITYNTSTCTLMYSINFFFECSTNNISLLTKVITILSLLITQNDQYLLLGEGWAGQRIWRVTWLLPCVTQDRANDNFEI